MPGPEKQYPIRFGDLRMTEEMRDAIERERGAESAAEWIRQAIEDRLNAVKAQEAQIGKG